MKRLFILLFSVVMAGEMTVDGNLTVADTLIVNNRDVITTIDSLLSLIAQLEMRISQLECQNTGIIPEGYCDCFFHTLDLCGVCNGDTTSCQDCAGVPNGDSLQDMCGYCDNDASNDCVQDCNGEWGGTAVEDVCGDCGGGITDVNDCNLYALAFDGIDDYVSINMDQTFANGVESFTIECWFKSNYPTEIGTKMIIGTYPHSHTQPFLSFYFEPWSNNVDFLLRSNEGQIDAESSINIFDNSWHHIAGVRDVNANKVTLFIDGLKVAEVGDNIGDCSNSENMSFMIHGNRFLGGLLGGIRISNSIRYVNDFIPNETYEIDENVLSYYKFNSVSESILYDYSGNENHGTIYGATWVERE